MKPIRIHWRWAYDDAPTDSARDITTPEDRARHAIASHTASSTEKQDGALRILPEAGRRAGTDFRAGLVRVSRLPPDVDS